MIIDAPVITIDGPSGSGKGTLCKAISKSLKWHFLDTGVFYRVLALVAMQDKLNINSEDVLMSIATYLDIRFFIMNNEIQVILSGKNITNQIRTQEVDNMASYVATFPRVRKALLHQQRMFRKKPGLIADGRDVGTIVFPDATIKIFLDATLTVRAYRRMLQLQANGFNVNLNQILTEIKERDYRDSNRSTSPLTPASDALVLNSTLMSSEQVVKKALDYIQQKLKM